MGLRYGPGIGFSRDISSSAPKISPIIRLLAIQQCEKFEESATLKPAIWAWDRVFKGYLDLAGFNLVTNCNKCNRVVIGLRMSTALVFRS